MNEKMRMLKQSLGDFNGKLSLVEKGELPLHDSPEFVGTLAHTLHLLEQLGLLDAAMRAKVVPLCTARRARR